MEYVSLEYSASGSNMDRIVSGETVESPFGSNLATPTDEEVYSCGIEERLEITNSIHGYFANKSVREISVSAKSLDKEASGEIPILKNIVSEDLADSVEARYGPSGEHCADGSTLVTFDSSQSVQSSLLSSGEVEEYSKTIYTLPNSHISIKDALSSELSAEGRKIVREEYQVPDEPKSHPHPMISGIQAAWTEDIRPLISKFTVRSFVCICARITCFLPWCIAVGGTIVLFPEYLHDLAFGFGYIDPPSGIRRFAYWAEYGLQHLTIFLGFLFIVLWTLPTAGLLLFGGLLAQFFYVWHSFIPDPAIPLGDDDLQTIFLLATTTWLNGDSIGIKKVGDEYYATSYISQTGFVDPAFLNKE